MPSQFSTRIEMEAFGDVQVSRELIRIGDRGMNLSPLWPVLGKYFNRMEEKQFASDGAFGGARWDPLSDSTIRSSGTHKILRLTGALYRSLTRRNAKGSRRKGTRGTLFVGSVIPYGVYHQSKEPRTKIPRRPPVNFREQDKIAWVKMIQQFVITGELPGVPGL